MNKISSEVFLDEEFMFVVQIIFVSFFSGDYPVLVKDKVDHHHVCELDLPGRVPHSASLPRRSSQSSATVKFVRHWFIYCRLPRWH